MTPAEAVDRLAATRVLLVALDFDGTLSPLVDEPMAARMLPEARTAIDALLAAPATVVAFVSGRSLADLRVIAEHDDDSPILLAGSHGAEHWMPEPGMPEPGTPVHRMPAAEHPRTDSPRTDSPGTADPRTADPRTDHPRTANPGTRAGPATPDELDERDRLRAAAERLVADVPGARIESKAFGFAVHSRTVAAAQRAAAHAGVDALMAREAPGWRRRSGHHVVEYAFRDVGKEAAVARLRADTGATAVLFAGDDVTDEDALQSLGPADVGVHVGPPPSAASVFVDDVWDLARLLEVVVTERARARE